MNGAAVDPWDKAACSWSMLGAFVAVLEHAAATTGEMPLKDLAAALYAIADVVHVDSLVEWNDADGRTQATVLDAFDRALASYACAFPEAPAS